ncbi:MAG: glycerol-3-phosphate 1-O-acyltransferase PlsY [Eubacterium sp.]|nr:glycerol-3-phosphate 1-O-acyltransferase PlsY [Eubacterium sp.]
MIWICYAVMIIVPYLLCGINSAIIVTRIKSHEDIRNLGSGNAGLTNTLRTQGKVAALFVLLGDVLKGVLSVIAVRLAFLLIAGIDTTVYDNNLNFVAFVAALTGILGHVFPVYFKFKGGKGILVSVSILMTVEWIPACILLGIFIILVAITRYVSLGSCVAAVLYGPTVLVYGLIVHDPCVYINTVIALLIGVLIVYMHRGNIVRLKNGTEKKLGQKA